MSIFCIQNVIAPTLFKNRKIPSICVFWVPIEKLLLKSNWKNSSLKINLQSFYDRCKSCLNICRGCSLILFKVTKQVSLIFSAFFLDLIFQLRGVFMTTISHCLSPWIFTWPNSMTDQGFIQSSVDSTILPCFALVMHTLLFTNPISIGWAYFLSKSI